MADRGRPSIYSPEIAEEIASRLSKGEPLAAICREEGMPSVSTVNNWRNADEAFSGRIVRAREDGFDAIALECLEIADDSGNDRRFVGPEGQEREVVDSDHIQRAKLRVETRLKLLAKWDPKRYGDKVALTGDADSDPIKTQLTVKFV